MQQVPGDERSDRVVFYPVAAIGALFCLSVFISTAAMFGDPAPPLKQWINRHATNILLGETALLMVIGVLAMTIDRLRTLRRLRESAGHLPRKDEHSAEATRVD